MGVFWPFGFPNWVKPQLDRIEAALAVVLQREIVMAGELDVLEAQVRRNADVTDSAVMLLQELKAKLDEAIQSGDMTRVAALAAELGTKTQALADAVSANTPAAPPAP